MARSICRKLLGLFALIFLFAAPALPAAAQDGQALGHADLDALLAPIALYPDPLLSKVLIAASFPDQVQQAASWLKSNPNLKGTALANAVAHQHWDENIKELALVPGVLEMMDDQRDWMYQLGGAFVNQQADVMASVQRLRRQAQNHGTLRTTSQQHVVEQGGSVVIQPASPQTMYVPYYNSNTAYGDWSYPETQPYSWSQPYGYGYAPGAALATGLLWGAGVAITAGLWANAFNWHGGGVWYGGGYYGHGAWNHGHYNNWSHNAHYNYNHNVNRNNNINRNVNRNTNINRNSNRNTGRNANRRNDRDRNARNNSRGSANARQNGRQTAGRQNGRQNNMRQNSRGSAQARNGSRQNRAAMNNNAGRSRGQARGASRGQGSAMNSSRGGSRGTASRGASRGGRPSSHGGGRPRR
jgi:hypothetical protein